MTVAPPSTSRPRRRAGPGGRVALTPSVTWRDGVHVTGTMLWFDARRAREVCVVSSIDRVARAGQAGHGQLIATAPTLAMLGVAGGAHGVGGGVALATPTRRPFTLGQVQLELVPSGHTLGAAALLVDVPAGRVLCAGPIAPRHVGLAEPAELRRCDTLVLDVPYGQRHHAFPSAVSASAAVADWALATTSRAVPVVLVSHLGKGLDAAHLLASVGLAPRVHPAIATAARRLTAAGLVAPPAPALRRAPRHGEVVVWLLADRHRLDRALGGAATRRLLASGLAADPDAGPRHGVDHAIAWSSAADREQNLALIRASHAGQIYLTGAGAEVIAAQLGPGAVVLAPPQQMELRI